MKHLLPILFFTTSALAAPWWLEPLKAVPVVTSAGLLEMGKPYLVALEGVRWTVPIPQVKVALEGSVANRALTCEQVGTVMPSGNWIGRCTLEGQNLSAWAIAQGLAVKGEYPESPRNTSQSLVAPAVPTVYYPNCASAREAGAAPIQRGQPGYRPELDADGDGVACE